MYIYDDGNDDDDVDDDDADDNNDSDKDDDNHEDDDNDDDNNNNDVDFNKTQRGVSRNQFSIQTSQQKNLSITIKKKNHK
jgi:hypothetical protein